MEEKGMEEEEGSIAKIAWSDEEGKKALLNKCYEIDPTKWHTHPLGDSGLLFCLDETVKVIATYCFLPGAGNEKPLLGRFFLE